MRSTVASLERRTSRSSVSQSSSHEQLGGHGFARRDDMIRFARELGVRVAVAAVALPIVGTALWLGDGYAAALFALAGAIAAYEYYRLTPLRAASAGSIRTP